MVAIGFEVWLETCLIPVLQPGEWVIGKLPAILIKQPNSQATTQRHEFAGGDGDYISSKLCPNSMATAIQL
jgi:hypothetical protein